MKAVETKSGKFRARYVDHYEIVNGRRKVVLGSVTRDTEREAAKVALALEKQYKAKEITISDCIDRYIKIKEPVLSPATVRSYRALQRNAYSDIAQLRPSDLPGASLQGWIGKYAADHSPKAVRNAYGLLSASVSMYAGIRLSATLPQRKVPELYTPTDADIKALLDHIHGKELEKAVLLAALGTLRRSEVCGLTYADIEGNTVHVRRSIVEKGHGEMAAKTPKTPQSTRAIELPPEVIAVLRRDPAQSGRVVEMTPTAISNAFSRAVTAVGLPHFRFHDLRAYSASVRHALGIPDQYIMRDGGWKTDAVLKAIYRRTMADKEAEFAAKINSHFSEMLR